MPAKLHSRFPQIAAELKPRMDVVCRQGAEKIVEDAKQRVPVATGKLRDAIHVERSKLAEYRVVAGDDEAWYGHLVEHGTSRTTPRPFLVPAAEANRGDLDRLAREALEHL